MSLREGRFAIVLGVLIQILFLISLKTQFMNPLFIEAVHVVGQAGDYYGIYQGGDNLVHGWSIYDSEDYRNEAHRRVPYFYFYRYLPPTAYVSALTSLVLSPHGGYVLWVVINELLLLLMVIWILRLDAYPIRDRRVHAGLWLCFFPFYLEQWMGQFSFLMGVFMWPLLRAGMPDKGGAKTPPGEGAVMGWAASVAVKSFPALFAIPYAVRRWWRPILLCAGAVIVVSLPYYILHPEDLKQFLLLNFRPLAPRVHGGTLGMAGLVRLIGWHLPESIASQRITIGRFDGAVGNIPMFAMSFFVVLLSMWATWKYRRSEMNLQLTLWTLAFFIVFKDIWESHYVMLLPFVTAIGLATRSRFVLWMGILFAIPTPYILFARPDRSLSDAANLLNHAVKPIPTVAFFIWTIREMARSARGALSPSAQNEG